MKLRKQIFAIILVVLFFTAFDLTVYENITKNYINHTSKEMQAKSIEVSDYVPFDPAAKTVKVDSTMKLSGELPVIDGAAALYPVFTSFVEATYPVDSVDFDGENFTDESRLQYTNTRGAYQAVVDGDADLIFCAKPSQEQLDYAASKGVTLELVPIGYEAFVFIVNKDNPVENLTTGQVRDIYAGKITNWSDVGGEKRHIDAVQRNSGSGSQTAMESFMGDTQMKRNLIGFDGSAIGFSFRYYVEGLVGNSQVKMIALDGVYPDKENISTGKYPIIANLYAVYNKDNENENIQKLMEWILSEEGQTVVEECGYVGL